MRDSKLLNIHETEIEYLRQHTFIMKCALPDDLSYACALSDCNVKINPQLYPI